MNHRGKSQTIAVEINGDDVSLVVKCADRYEAMMFYDKLTEQLQSGYVKVEFAAPGHEHKVEGNLS